MPVLPNERWEKFAQGVARGESATAAYLAAGYKASEEGARRTASRLLTKVDVANRVEEIRGKTAQRNKVTQDSLIAELDELAQAAAVSGQHSAAVSAVMGKAKITGHIVADRKNHKDPLEDATDEQLAAAAMRARKEVEELSASLH